MLEESRSKTAADSVDFQAKYNEASSQLNLLRVTRH